MIWTFISYGTCIIILKYFATFGHFHPFMATLDHIYHLIAIGHITLSVGDIYHMLFTLI